MSLIKKILNRFKSQGVPGIQHFGGFLVEEEKNSKLTGIERYKTYSQILTNVSIVAAGTRYFLNLVTKPEWHVEPADDSLAAEEKAEQVQRIMDNLATPWRRVIRRAAMYRFYGYSVQEWTAKFMDDGTIGLEDIAPRPQRTIERWEIRKNGTIAGVYQRAPNTGQEIFIPREKIVYLVDDSLNDSPEGLGLFRHLVEPATRLQRYEHLESVGFETDLRGVPIGRGPFALLMQMEEEGKIDKAQRKALEEPLRKFIQNHIRGKTTGIVMDSSVYESQDESGKPSTNKHWDVDLLKSGITSQEAIASAIQRITTECARIIGVEGLLLGGQGKGSLALSRDKSHNFYLIVDSTLSELVDTFQKDIINSLWMLNGWPDELKPKLKTDAVQFRDVETISRSLRDMALAGAPIDPEDIEVIAQFRDLLGLPRPPARSSVKEVDDEVIPIRSQSGVPNSVANALGQ